MRNYNMASLSYFIHSFALSKKFRLMFFSNLELPGPQNQHLIGSCRYFLFLRVIFLFLQIKVKSPTLWSLFNFNIFTGNAPGEEVSIFLKWIIVTFSLINDHLCICSFEWWYVTKRFSVEVLSIYFIRSCSGLYIRFSRLFYHIPNTQR